jgi:uncharacterized membrane protein YwaF
VVPRFVLAFTALSLLFTLLSWGHASSEPFWERTEVASGDLAFHLLRHALLGGLVALPTRRIDYILAAAIAAVLIDVDHLNLLGIPTVSRSSHSLGFLVLIMVTMGTLARLGLLGEKAPAVLTSVVAGAAVCAHVTLDVVETSGYFPLWAPVSYEMVRLTGPWAVGTFTVAAVVVAAATVLEMRARYTRKPTQKAGLYREYQ